MLLRGHLDLVCVCCHLSPVTARPPSCPTVAQLQLPVTWRPVLLGGLYRATDAPQGAAGSASDVMPAAKVALLGADLRRAAARQGSTMVWNSAHPKMRTVEAQRLIVAAPPQVRPAVAQRLYELYWCLDARVDDPDVLDGVAEQFGVPAAARDGDAAKDELRRNTDEALALGAWGVPVFHVEGSSEFFW